MCLRVCVGLCVCVALRVCVGRCVCAGLCVHACACVRAGVAGRWEDEYARQGRLVVQIVPPLVQPAAVRPVPVRVVRTIRCTHGSRNTDASHGRRNTDTSHAAHTPAASGSAPARVVRASSARRARNGRRPFARRTSHAAGGERAAPFHVQRGSEGNGASAGTPAWACVLGRTHRSPRATRRPARPRPRRTRACTDLKRVDAAA